MSKPLTIIIDSESSLSNFAHKFAKAAKMKPSSVKHCIAQTQGCSHTSVLIRQFPTTTESPETIEYKIVNPGTTLFNFIYETHGSDLVDELTEAMDDLVFDHVGTDSAVSDNINNAGLGDQIDAVQVRVGMEPIWALFSQYDVNIEACKETLNPVDTNSIAAQTEDPLSMVINALKIESIDEVNDGHIDKLETDFIETAKEMTWNQKELDKAVKLLNANGCSTLSSLLVNLAKAEAKLSFVQANCY